MKGVIFGKLSYELPTVKMKFGLNSSFVLKNNLIVTSFFFFLHRYSQDKMSNVCWKEEKKSYLQRNVVQIVKNAKTMRGMR